MCRWGYGTLIKEDLVNYILVLKSSHILDQQSWNPTVCCLNGGDKILEVLLRAASLQGIQCNAQLSVKETTDLCFSCTEPWNRVLLKSCLRNCDFKPLLLKGMMFGVLPRGNNSNPDNEMKDNSTKDDRKRSFEATIPDNAECTNAQNNEGTLSQNSRSNFFIDASSLLDETEVKLLQNTKSEDPPPAPPPFIRRKTFELDADDDKVAVLRQEYERRQGNLLFQSCGVDAPSSLPVGLPHLPDDDLHTPDSLNNDVINPEGFEMIEESTDLGSLNTCNEDLNRNELVSPAPSPVGDYIGIHKDSIDAGSIVNDADDEADNGGTDSGHAHTDESGQTTDNPPSMDSQRDNNKIHAVPILSGGVAPERIQSPMFSRRKTEYAPILSGAAPPLSPDPGTEEKPKNTSVSSLASAWVVDISDIVSSPETRRKRDRSSESRSLSSSFGYFIDLKDKSSENVLSGSCGPTVMQRSAGNSSSPHELRKAETLDNPHVKILAPRKLQNNFLRQCSVGDNGSMKSNLEKAASQESSLGIGTDKRLSPLPVRPNVVYSPEQKMFTMFFGLDKEEPINQRPEVLPRRKFLNEKGDFLKSKGSDTELSSSSTDDKSSSSRKQPVYMYIGSETPSTNCKVPYDQESGPLFKKQHIRAKSISTSAAGNFAGSKEDLQSQPTSLHEQRTNSGNFVRLSDLDKAPSPTPRTSENTSTFTLENKRRSWKPRSALSNYSESLVRVFPALRDASSPMSSISIEDDSSDQTTSNEFWQDLKHIFLNNVCTDMVVEVAGRRIGAHKTVLTHRCPYFAAALSGGWVESGGNVIRLRGFSYPSVHFALYHIYVGTLTIPEHTNIVELAMLCDLFHLDSLKDMVELEFSKKMCHMFHDPQTLKCSCIPGVFETLVVAATYNLESLYPTCLGWCSSHFYKVCQTLPFVTLPNELKDKILKTIVSNCDKEELTKEESLELKIFTAVNAVRLILWVERTDWARAAVSWFHRLRDKAHKVVAKAVNLLISNSSSFHLLVRDSADAVLLYSIQFMSPEELCLVYRTLFRARTGDSPKKYPEGAKTMLNDLYDAIVMQLVAQISKVTKTRAWEHMDDAMQSPILGKAGFPLRHQTRTLQRSATDDKTFQRRERLSPAWSGPNPNRLQNLRQVKQVIAQHVARANQGTLDPVPLRRSAVPVPEKVQVRPAASAVKRREVKARYLEIKSRPTKPKTNESSAEVSLAQRHSYCAPATATSSDSSAVTPTESISDAAAEKPVAVNPARNRLSVPEEGLTTKPKETTRPSSGPTKHIAASWNAPRRCASSSLVESAKTSSAVSVPKSAKDRVSMPPPPTAPTATKAKRVGLTLSTSLRVPLTSSASVSAPTSASTSFSKAGAPKLNRSSIATSTPPATAPVIRSRLNIPLRTSRSSSSVPHAPPAGIRRDQSKTSAENAPKRVVQTRAHSKATPLKPLNGPREPSKKVNGFSNKPNTRTVACETSDLTNKSRSTKPALKLSLNEKNGGPASISTSDMATDTSDIPPTPDDEPSSSKSKKAMMLASRSGTFLKDEPTVLRKRPSDES